MKKKLAEFWSYITATPTRKKLSGLTVVLLLYVMCLCCCFSIVFSKPPKSTPTPTLAPTIFIPTLTTAPTTTFTPSPSPTTTLTPTSTTDPLNTPTLTSAPTLSIPVGEIFAPLNNGALRETALVVAIVDGDTIKVQMDGKVYSLRYIGIDTPEVGQVFAAEATQANSLLVAGKTVTLISDVSNVDRFGRLLRYVIADGVFVNYELVREGFAIAKRYPPDTACSAVFVSAQAQAQLYDAGRWAATQIPLATQTPRSGGINTNCDPAYPDVCIAPYPPDLDCGQIPFRRFRVLPPDPHKFDRDGNGFGCEG